jgi:translation initiation factor 2 alpha subunit (eIF-2alpha)
MKVMYISAPSYTIEVKTKDPKNEEKKMVEKLDGIIDRSKQMKIEMSYKLVRE